VLCTTSSLNYFQGLSINFLQETIKHFTVRCPEMKSVDTQTLAYVHFSLRILAVINTTRRGGSALRHGNIYVYARCRLNKKPSVPINGANLIMWYSSFTKNTRQHGSLSCVSYTYSVWRIGAPCQKYWGPNSI